MPATTFRHPLDRLRRHSLMTKSIAAKIPALYATENDKDPIVRLKLFGGGGAVWYITEFDGEDRMFGWCDLGLGQGELGYVSLDELASLQTKIGLPFVERDIYFSPKPLSALVQK